MQRIVTSLLSDMKLAPGLMDIGASASGRLLRSVIVNGLRRHTLAAVGAIDTRIDEAFIKRAGYRRRRVRRAMESIRRTLSSGVRRIAIR